MKRQNMPNWKSKSTFSNSVDNGRNRPVVTRGGYRL